MQLLLGGPVMLRRTQAAMPVNRLLALVMVSMRARASNYAKHMLVFLCRQAHSQAHKNILFCATLRCGEMSQGQKLVVRIFDSLQLLSSVFSFRKGN